MLFSNFLSIFFSLILESSILTCFRSYKKIFYHFLVKFGIVFYLISQNKLIHKYFILKINFGIIAAQKRDFIFAPFIAKTNYCFYDGHLQFCDSTYSSETQATITFAKFIPLVISPNI
ncbi:hypothetical protein BpHYR1_049191 [Brachionus plicatilis]|uniref:Uncharacterized protein n=1 Tax=Brachionus plicatilis TaxID=10195 RepID=A0A3M7S816_BRAPC|nr:hypothetical protein BpHYR1_049191 [Brachionus plicatilis]